LNILRQYINGNKRITEYTRDGITVSHVVVESIDKAEKIPDHVPPFTALQEENEKLKERLAMLETAVDDIIFGGGF
jgi:hypothetical protein